MNEKDMKETVDWIYSTLRVFDENGTDMLISKYDTDILLLYNNE